MPRRPEPDDPDRRRAAEDRLALVLAGPHGRRAAPEPPHAGLDPHGRDDHEVEGQDYIDDLEPMPTTTRFGRTHLAVVAALVAIGLAITGWALLRSRPVALASPGSVSTVAVSTVPVSSGPASPADGTPSVPATSPTAAPGPSGGNPSGGSTPPGLVVHVLGAVRHPGLVDLPAGSRVEDAIRAAGGLTARADPGQLNLAQHLTDGQQVVIGTRTKPAGEVRDGTAAGGPTGGAGGAGPGGAAAVLDLNAATAAQLEELPGVGPVTAGRIVAWRTEHGRFSRVEELQEVDGIGPKTYAQLAPLVRV